MVVVLEEWVDLMVVVDKAAVLREDRVVDFVEEEELVEDNVMDLIEDGCRHLLKELRVG